MAYANGGVEPDTFSAVNSVVLFLIVVIGGLSAVSGPVLGAAVYGLVQLGGVVAIHLLNGIGTIVVLAVRPGGLAGVVSGLRDAAIRVIMHVQGHDLIRLSGKGNRIAIAERSASDVVPVTYRLTGDGFGPVEGTRLRSVEGAVAPERRDRGRRRAGRRRTGRAELPPHRRRLRRGGRGQRRLAEGGTR